MKLSLTSLFLIPLISLTVFANGQRHTWEKRKPSALEIPELNVKIPEQILRYRGYTVSYNSSTRLPNWVAYELTRAEAAGTFPRDSHFYVDSTVVGPQADNDDYRRSGWDKGHMAPAGDMKWSSHAMYESCYFTNICPQNPNLNGGDWRLLEEKCRVLVQQFETLYIACGPIIGQAKNGTLGAHNVVIPDAYYKVLLYARGFDYQGIGFVFLNKAGHKALQHYAVPIDTVEELTGIDFFVALPNATERKVEAVYDLEGWGLR